MERLTIKAPSGLIHLKDSEDMTVNAAIKKLSDYEDLEEQGLLLKLPCKVGDTVYTLNPVSDGKTVIAQLETDTFFMALCVMEADSEKTYSSRNQKPRKR